MKKAIAKQDLRSIGGEAIPKGTELVIRDEYIDCTGLNYDISSEDTEINGVPEYKIEIRGEDKNAN